MSDDNTSPMAAYLADNPRKMGALFTALLIIAHAGSASAALGAGLIG